MILTEKQRAVYGLMQNYTNAPGEPMTASRITRELGIPNTSAYDRLRSLERKGMVKPVIIAGKIFYYPLPEPPDEPPKPRKPYIHVDHGIAEPDKDGGKRNPITWEEVEQAKRKLKYRAGGKKGTPLKVLKGYEPDFLTGTMTRILETVEPIKAYPNGVLCKGRKLRRFIRWIDIAIYFRNPKKAVGEYRREKLK